MASESDGLLFSDLNAGAAGQSDFVGAGLV
jgi:hypothetical protein